MSHSQPTASLCPVCLSRLPAHRVIRGDRVFLEKRCPDHGDFAVRIWDGLPAFDGWQRPKIATQMRHTGHAVEQGCPFDCGLCPDHRQHSCTIILEVTGRCNLSCPVCYADSQGMNADDPPLTVIAGWYAAARQAGSGCNIQLSGGEPTLRDDLTQIVGMGRDEGFDFIQINTNGLRLAREPDFVRDLATAGLASVFLQFDGADDRIYRQLRGRPLLAEKLAAIEACEAHRIGVVLVPTLVPGINDRNIGDILKLAVGYSPVVRAVHFQPISYFGRFLHSPEDADRLTLPQLLRHIEAQSHGAFKVADFSPPGCENSLCSFNASFLVMPDGSVRALSRGAQACCCSTPTPAAVGAAKAIDFVARQWQSPQVCCDRPASAALPALEGAGIMDLDAFIQRARTHRLAVSAMAFQDVWNLDLERVRDCCIHVMAPDTRLVPFCLYNLTSCDGKRLYRP